MFECLVFYQTQFRIFVLLGFSLVDSRNRTITNSSQSSNSDLAAQVSSATTPLFDEYAESDLDEGLE